MDFSVVEKYKDHLIAFGAGAIVFSAITWTVANNLHSKKIDILEISLRENQKKLGDAQSSLEKANLSLEKAHASAANVLASLKTEQGKYSRKQELSSLLRSIDEQIAAKKRELIMASPISVASRHSDNEPKGELYLQAEEELKSLLQQRNEVSSQLIRSSNVQ